MNEVSERNNEMAEGVRRRIANDTQRDLRYPSIVQIKSAIPNRFFESNILLSFYYAVKDIVIIYSLYKAMQFSETYLPMCFVYVLFPIYWYLQGTMLMAVFVVGHDCGHGSFTRYDVINDITGTVLHSLVLAPYYPWKLSHRNHHKHTGNIDKDEVFYPIRIKNHNGNKFVFLFGLGIGWFIYLLRGYHPRKICHFNPFEAMFSNHVTGCTVSLLSLALWGYCLYEYACVQGVVAAIKYYFLPELVFASWLLTVTFLHHIEEETPWYSDENWNYVKGQLSSIDRRYGWAHDIIHNIGTHQIHHLFPKIPHYHLEEATFHFRKQFPDLARQRDDPIIPSMFRMYQKFSDQFVVDDTSTVHVYK